MKKRRVLLLVALAALIVAMLPAVATADPSIDPASVEELVFPGESVEIDKTVGTPELPPVLDVCLVVDLSGSYSDDLPNIKALAPDIWDDIVTGGVSDLQFGLATFVDFPFLNWGSAGAGDYAYRLDQDLTPTKGDWVAAVNAMATKNGRDEPESQYEALYQVATGAGNPVREPGTIAEGLGCTYRDNATKVVMLTTDASFHNAGDGGGPFPYPGASATDTTNALVDAGIKVIGLKAPGAGLELDALADATGGSVVPTAADSSDIAEAILEALQAIQIEVSMQTDCTDPIGAAFDPDAVTVEAGDDAAFTETISVEEGAAGGTYNCEDEAYYDDLASGQVESKTIHVPGITLEPETDTNELTAGAEHTVTATITAGDYGPVEDVRVEFEITDGPNAGLTGSDTTDASGDATFTWVPGAISSTYLGDDTVVASFTDDADTVVYGSDTATKEWIDTTPPIAACLEGPNPGGKVPQAPGSGQNEDGFYLLDGSDEVWADEDLVFFVVDTGSGTVFGPYPKGTTIKYTEAGKVKDPKPIGGPNSAVDWHITGTGDAQLLVIDGSGNEATASCLVPPPPK